MKSKRHLTTIEDVAVYQFCYHVALYLHPQSRKLPSWASMKGPTGVSWKCKRVLLRKCGVLAERKTLSVWVKRLLSEMVFETGISTFLNSGWRTTLA